MAIWMTSRRALALGGLIGATLHPAAWAAADAPTDCAQSALQAVIRERYPFVSATLRPLDTAAAAARLGQPCTVHSVDKAMRREMDVVLDVADAGRIQRRRVSFEVSARMAVWRLPDAASADAALKPNQLEQVVADALAEHDAVPADKPMPAAAWRLRQSLPAGHILKTQDVVPADHVLRGDAVSVVYRAGSLVLQTQGTALSQAAPGDVLRVAMTGQRQPVQGVLETGRLVEVHP